MSKFNYLAHALGKSLAGPEPRCPSCESRNSTVVARKYLLTSLRRCEKCFLLFRVPTTSAGENQIFYQKNYQQDFVTDMPAVEDLPALLKDESGLKGPRSHKSYLQALSALGGQKGQRVLDFGCSWDYGTWQIAQAGYEVEGFEISKIRAEYGRTHLNVPIATELANLEGSFDIFICVHVLEHVPGVRAIMDKAFQLLKSGGLFLAVTPNGTEEFRNLNPEAWSMLWGEVHPNFLDDRFYANYFGDKPYLLSSLPCADDLLRGVDFKTGGLKRLPCDTWELMVAARKTENFQ